MADGVFQGIGVPRRWWDPEGSLRSHTVPRDFPLLHRFQACRSSCTVACAPDTAPTAAAHTSAHTDVGAHPAADPDDGCSHTRTCSPIDSTLLPVATRLS